MNPLDRTLPEIVGPWQEPEFKSDLIDRMRNLWLKPLGQLTNHEVATCLRQRTAIDDILPLAKARVADHIIDDSELYDAELVVAISDTEYWLRADAEDRRIRGLPPRERNSE